MKKYIVHLSISKYKNKLKFDINVVATDCQ